MEKLIISVFVRLFLDVLRKFKRKIKLRSELEIIKRRIIYVSTINEIPILLKKLRDFLIENNLSENDLFKKFILKWLMSPIVGQGIHAVNVFSINEIVDLQSEVKLLNI